jgi:peptide/nickel transport system substrate-binding protein
LEYRIIPDTTALTDAIMSGESILMDSLAQGLGDRDRQQRSCGTSAQGSLLLAASNNKNAPLDNPKVEAGNGLALDRDALVAGAFFGQAVPILGGVVPEWNWGFAGIEFFKKGADVEGAKKLLAEAGHPDGFETSMTIASSFPAMMAMAPIIQANLAAVGIKASIGTMEIPRY